MPDQGNQVTGLAELRARAATLADRYYDHLVQAGEDALPLYPLVHVSAAAEGQVLWSRRLGLEGYAVSTMRSDRADPQFERIGFSADDQHEGLWVLRGVRYEGNGDGFTGQPVQTSHLFAHYDQATGWHVRQLLDPDDRPGDQSDAGLYDDWVRRCVPAALSDEQKAVIARIAQETGMLVDAALTLEGSFAAYRTLDEILMDRAQQAGHVDQMGVIVMPDRYPTRAGRQFRVSGFGDLLNLGPNLHGRLADEARRDLAGLTTGDAGARLCPPYEQGTPTLMGSPPSSARARPRAQDRSRAPGRRDRGRERPGQLPRRSSLGRAQE